MTKSREMEKNTLDIFSKFKYECKQCESKTCVQNYAGIVICDIFSVLPQ